MREERDEGKTTCQIRSPPTLIQCHLVECALDLGQIECGALDLNCGLENRLDLAELVLVACDEVDKVTGGGWGRHL